MNCIIIKKIIIFFSFVFLVASCGRTELIIDEPLKKTSFTKVDKGSSNVDFFEEGDLDSEENLEEFSNKTNTGSKDLKIGFNIKILSIEEQYCLSKGGKNKSEENEKYCIQENGKKCELYLFYMGNCVDDDINVEEKNIEKEEIIEKEIVKEDIGVKITNIQFGKSGKYFIETLVNGNTNLVLSNSSYGNKIIFSLNYNSGSNRGAIIDYELMYNKQIKVFYEELSSMRKKEKIIDLNNILTN